VTPGEDPWTSTTTEVSQRRIRPSRISHMMNCRGSEGHSHLISLMKHFLSRTRYSQHIENEGLLLLLSQFCRFSHKNHCIVHGHIVTKSFHWLNAETCENIKALIQKDICIPIPLTSNSVPLNVCQGSKSFGAFRSITERNIIRAGNGSRAAMFFVKKSEAYWKMSHHPFSWGLFRDLKLSNYRYRVI
jgi:hypothetical protein